MAQFNVQQFIDEQRLGAVHYRILAICTLVMFIDGFDIFIVGKMAPLIAKSLGKTSEAMTLVFFVQQIGLAIGAFVATSLADRFGRQRMLVLCSACFGLLSLATAFSTTIEHFAVLRGLSGLFLSGGLPMAVSLLAELTPRGQRGTFISISFAGYSAGGAAGGAVAAWLVDSYGWQSGFWIGGIMPLLSLPLLLIFTPESLPFMVARDQTDSRIARTILRFAPATPLTGQEAFVISDGSAPKGKAGLLDIFRDGRARTTVIIWLACLLSMGTIALLAAWLPTFFQEMAGIPVQRFAVLAMIGFAGGLAGTIIVGRLMDKMRAAILIPGCYLCLGGVLLLLGIVPFDAPAFVVVLIAMNFFQTGGQTGLNTLMTRVYPTSMRSTGLGWAGGTGRFGGIIAPLFGGYAVAADYSLGTTFTIIALMPVAVAILVLFLRDASHISAGRADQPTAAAA